jgi:tight adherence protein B
MLTDLLENPIVFAGLIALSGGMLFYALIYPLLSGEARSQKRVDSFAVATNRAMRGPGVSMGMRKKKISETLKDIEQKQKASTKFSLEDRLRHAGLEWTRSKLIMVSVTTGVLLAFITFVFKQNILFAAIAFIFGGVILPHFLLNYLSKKRTKKFISEFPNALDIIIRGVKSGLPLGDCLRIISVEAAEPVSSEFKHIVNIQQLGLSMGDACCEMYKRIPTVEANFFGIVIQIQQKAGGNLGEILSGLSKVIRERRKMKGKIIAMSTEATASAGIIASLPFVVGILVFLTAPQYIEKLWTTDAGIHGLMAGAALMTVGVLVMKKMINFDI